MEPTADLICQGSENNNALREIRMTGSGHFLTAGAFFQPESQFLYGPTRQRIPG